MTIFEPTPTGDEAVDVVFRRLQQAMRGQATDVAEAIEDGDQTVINIGIGNQQRAQGLFFQTFEDPVEADWNIRLGSPTVTYPSNGVVGGKAFRCDGYLWMAYPSNIPFDPARLYRFRARMRMVTAPTDPLKDNAYFGFEGVAADGTTLVNTVGADTFSSQHYAAVVDFGSGHVLGDWYEFTGYYKGVAATGTTQGATAQTPAQAHQDVRYIRPMFILNYEGGDGVMELDYIAIEVMTEDLEIDAQEIVDGDLLVNANQAASIFGQPFSSATIASLMSGSAITEVQIEDDAITTPKIAANQIVAGHILAGEITGDKIDANTITAANIDAATITATEIAVGTILTGNIAADQITSALIAADQILTAHIAAGQVDTLELAAGAVTATIIDAGAVTAGKISAGAVEAGNIAAGAISTSALFVSGVVDNAAIGLNAVDSAEIAAGAINSGTMIAGGVIVTGHMTAGSIDADRLSAGTVDTTQLAANAVIAGKIDAAAITAGKIAAGAVNATNIIANGMILTAHMTAGTINADRLTAGTVTATQLTGASLSELYDDAGIIVSGELRNAAGTYFIDLDAGGASPFIKGGSDFEVLANGAVTVGGTISAELFTGANLVLDHVNSNIKLGQSVTYSQWGRKYVKWSVSGSSTDGGALYYDPGSHISIYSGSGNLPNTTTKMIECEYSTTGSVRVYAKPSSTIPFEVYDDISSPTMVFRVRNTYVELPTKLVCPEIEPTGNLTIDLPPSGQVIILGSGDDAKIICRDSSASGQYNYIEFQDSGSSRLAIFGYDSGENCRVESLVNNVNIYVPINKGVAIHAGSANRTLSFFDGSLTAKQTITGATVEAALTDLLASLASYGLITDSHTY